MSFIHKDLAGGRWFELSFLEQMANIGSEIFRTISWRDKNKDYGQKAFERSLELFDLTVQDPKNRKRLKEILRARELWADYIYGGNQYNQTDALWQNYFYAFNWAASGLGYRKPNHGHLASGLGYRRPNHGLLARNPLAAYSQNKW